MAPCAPPCPHNQVEPNSKMKKALGDWQGGFKDASLALSLSLSAVASRRVLTQQGNEKGAHRCSGAPTTY